PSLHDALPIFLDLALGAVELLTAERVEFLSAFPQGERLVERRLPLLEPPDDLFRLGLRLLERELRLGHPRSTSSTRAPKAPSATRMSTRVPGATSVLAVTTFDSVRTIAYPRSSVF